MKKEVREGYKMTELGEIPEDWNMQHIKNITLEHKQGYYSKDEYCDNGMYLVRITDLLNQKIDFSNMPKIEVSENIYNQYKIELGDFLFARSGAIGRYGIYNNLEYPQAIFASYIIRFRFDDKKINNKYFGYFYESDYCINQLKRITQGSCNININANNIKDLSICLPSLVEQEKIASILLTVDEQIDNTEKLIQKNQELKKGLMQQLLTKGIGHTKFKKTEIGEIPEGWEVIELINLSKKIGDGLHGTPVYNENGEYYFINGNNLVNGKIIFADETKMVDKKEYEKYKKKLNENTILISLNGTIGNLAFYNFEKIVLGKSSGYITLKDNISKNYVFYILNSERVKQYFIKELTGSTIKNLSLNTLRKTKFPIPSLLEQEKIASILSTVDEQIEEYQNKKEKLEELKKGLMQQLLTGKIRVV